MTLRSANAIHERGYWLDNHGHFCDPGLAPELLKIIPRLSSFWDMGCGSGDYTRFLLQNGRCGFGLDGNPNLPNEFCLVKGDLSMPLILPAHDWVLCLEVGEHVPQAYEGTLISNLHRHNREGMILSWFPPIGRPVGHGHVNEKYNNEIRALIEPLGYISDMDAEKSLREAAFAWWFQQSLMVFRRKK